MTNTAMQKAPTTAPEKKKDLLFEFLDGPGVRERLAQVASKYLTPDAVVRMALLAASRNPDIRKCTQNSILSALMDAAALGIKPGGLMGRGYLVPRKRNWKDDAGKWHSELECSFDPGWRGLVDVARRGGEIKRIEAHPVYEGEVFRVRFGLHSDLIHEPLLDANRSDKIVAAYAVAEFQDGSTQFEVLTAKDLAKIKASSASANGPWKNWEEEMSRKSAVKRLAKYLPYSADLDKAIELADRIDHAPDIVVREAVQEGVPAAEKPRTKALADKIRGSLPEGGSVPMPANDEEQGVVIDAQQGRTYDASTGEVAPEDEPREPGSDDA